MKISEWFKLQAWKVKDFIKRHIVYVLLGGVAMLLLKAAFPLTWTATAQLVLQTCIITAITIFLSSMAVYCFTRIDFISEKDTAALGRIYQGTCILIGMIVLGTYIANL